MAVRRKRKGEQRKGGLSQRKHFSELLEARGKSRGRILTSLTMTRNPRRGARRQRQRLAAGI